MNLGPQTPENRAGVFTHTSLFCFVPVHWMRH